MHASLLDASLSGSVDDLQRQTARVVELAHHLDALVAQMPTADAGAAWWGPAREAVQVALDIERERLWREAQRAHGAADQLRLHLSAASGLLPAGLP